MRQFVLLLCLCLASCVKVHTLRVDPVDLTVAEPIVVESPVKVHLVDGSTVVFAKGISVADGTISGEGFRYDLMLRLQEPIVAVPVKDVAAIEAFQSPINTGATAAATTGVTVGATIAGIGLALAIFGSCPTTYSLQDTEPVMEAESFSYSIAPGFEARDLDRLGIVFHGDDVVLEVRNEALETHYINQLELFAVNHDDGEFVYADHRDRPLVLGELQAATAAIDNSGRQVRDVIAAADDDSWRSPDERLAAVTDTDFDDHIILSFDVQPGSNNAMVLRLRNSLLNTVLLYEVMLADQGWLALDWMGKDLNSLFGRWRLGSWYRKNMGMQVSVHDGERWVDVARFGDTGPIAWKELAIPLPRQQRDRLEVRLSFVADNWRIDRAAIAPVLREAALHKVPIREIRDAVTAVHETARDNLAEDDDRYVITRPGEHLRVHFATDALTPGADYTFFMAATGYYMEWMRRDWLTTPTATRFKPGDTALIAAINRWNGQRDEMRRQFEASKIRVR